MCYVRIKNAISAAMKSIKILFSAHGSILHFKDGETFLTYRYLKISGMIHGKVNEKYKRI